MIKVVCCGLPKTGTKSIIKALDILSYKSLHHPGPILVNGIFKNIWKVFEEYNIEAIAEGVAVVLWKEIYYKYPKAKFILTTRFNWVERVKNIYISTTINSGRRLSRKLRFGNKSKKFYLNHNAKVREFFKDKPNQLLEMNIFEGDGWRKLCIFLGIKRRQRPKFPFPHVRLAKVYKDNNLNRFLPRNRGGSKEWR